MTTMTLVVVLAPTLVMVVASGNSDNVNSGGSSNVGGVNGDVSDNDGNNVGLDNQLWQ